MSENVMQSKSYIFYNLSGIYLSKCYIYKFCRSQIMEADESED